MDGSSCLHWIVFCSCPGVGDLQQTFPLPNAHKDLDYSQLALSPGWKCIRWHLHLIQTVVPYPLPRHAILAVGCKALGPGGGKEGPDG